jgi:hypothetical protein
MEKIKVEFVNCYGIKALKYEFDTSEGRAFLIYAPNGSMKTSFARVFSDIYQGRKPSDVIFPHRATKCFIKDENNNNITADRIFVVEPYLEDYSSNKTATLLADKTLRQQYERLVKSIDEKAKLVLAKMGEAAGIKKNIQYEIATSFKIQEKNILDLLESIESSLIEENNPGLSDIDYGEVINDKVLMFLSSEDIRRQLKEYVERYDELISNSVYFRQGIFDHNNATNVSKSLQDNGFFSAKHTIMMTGQDSNKIELSTAKQLELLITTEKHKILNDSELVKRFEAIDKAITKNSELRQFRRYLDKNRKLIPELADIDTLRKRLWISYSFIAKAEYAAFASTYRTAKIEIEQVIKTAKEQETEWRKVVSIFHERFSVPFSLEIKNQDDVILKNETLSLVFKYKDEQESREIGKGDLFNALSTGEKRAFYLLNIIFEIEALKREPKDTVLILDDIADSFDYKNKYAIVEYIKEILETNKFIIIILTHNFDFFRTVQSRLAIGRRKNCLMAIKSSCAVELKKAAYLNPFLYWRNHLNEPKILIASIPMIRNLIEYTWGRDNPTFVFLTALLHKKPNTETITMKELADVCNTVLGMEIAGNSEKVFKIIFEQADSCNNGTDSINLENKVVLSIAIRLLADILMINKINDPLVTDNIGSNQTRDLFNLFKTQFSGDRETISLLEKVVLMTPETIHLNSFMYEPILDMSDEHLKNLYSTLKTLS